MAGQQDRRSPTQQNLDAGRMLLQRGAQGGGADAGGSTGSPMDAGGQQPDLNGLLTQLASQQAYKNPSGIPGAVQQKLPAGAGGGTWDGPLGAVPTHHGWAGMQEAAKQWTLRLLGTNPNLRFSSGYRTPEQNAAANGHPNSGHMRGWKADFSGSTRDLHAAAEWAKRYGARVLLHNAGSGYHLDVSWDGVPLY